MLRESSKCKYSERPAGMRYCNTHDCSGMLAIIPTLLYQKVIHSQKKRQHTTRASTWFRTTMIQAVVTSFPTAAWSWKANCAAMPTTMRTAASHADWFRTNCFKCIVCARNNGKVISRVFIKKFFCCHQILKCNFKTGRIWMDGVVRGVRHRHIESWQSFFTYLKAHLHVCLRLEIYKRVVSRRDALHGPFSSRKSTQHAR